MSQNIRVLIVDDLEDDALLLTDELRKNGYNSTWTRVDAPEDMEQALLEQTWDIIIADYTMPGFGGAEALKILQATELDIPFILVSGTTDEHTCVDVMRAGAQDFIYKHSLSRLAPAVKRELAEVEIRRKQRQAEENATRLAAIVESSEDAIVGKTLDGIITTWNLGAEKMYGYTADEVLGQSFETIVPPDRRDESTMFTEMVRRGEAVSRFETVRLTKEGVRLHVSMSVSPIKDQDGQIVGASTIARDITELQLTEQHKREFYQRTILAATNGKLLICEKDEIDLISGSLIASWTIANKEELAVMRDEISIIAREEGMEKSRVSELLGCVVEAGANAIKHADGGCASLHRKSDSLLFTISDTGPGIGALALPDVALTKGYSTAGTLGMGYKVMIQYADRLYLATGPEGTTVAAEIGIHSELSDRDTLLQKLAGW